MSYCIIVPFRDREKHLVSFLENYKDLDAPIYVIEQADNKPFNRGKLFNAGFLEVGKNFTHAIYHDVDMRLNKDLSDYSVFDYPKDPVHLASFLQQQNWGIKDPLKWVESYELFFGGICALSRTHMEKSNGWSNNIWGWGHEDDEMRSNLVKAGYSIERRKAYINCTDHERKFDAKLMYQHKTYLQGGRQKDGLDHCKYEVVRIDEFDNYTKISLNL